MKFNFLVLLIFFELMILDISLAAEGRVCPEVSDQQYRVAIQQMPTRGYEDCLIRSSSASVEEPPKRQWIWNSEGRFSVFSDIANGLNSKTTGEKSYYLIPVEDQLKLSGIGPRPESYTVQLGQSIWAINKKTNTMKLPANCKGAVYPLTTRNEGGVDLQSCENKIVIDVGWKLGNAPESTKTSLSKLRDSRGHSCSVMNSKLFNYGQYGNFYLKYKTQSEWVSFFRTIPECAELSKSLQGKPRLNSDERAVRGNSSR